MNYFIFSLKTRLVFSCLPSFLERTSNLLRKKSILTYIPLESMRKNEKDHFIRDIHILMTINTKHTPSTMSNKYI